MGNILPGIMQVSQRKHKYELVVGDLSSLDRNSPQSVETAASYSLFIISQSITN